MITDKFGRYDIIDGEYIVKRRRYIEYRISAIVMGTRYTGEWSNTLDNAARSYLAMRMLDCVDDPRHTEIDRRIESRVRDVELSRIHVNKVIRSIGHLSHDTEKRPAYGGWDLH